MHGKKSTRRNDCAVSRARSMQAGATTQSYMGSRKKMVAHFNIPPKKRLSSSLQPLLEEIPFIALNEARNHNSWGLDSTHLSVTYSSRGQNVL